MDKFEEIAAEMNASFEAQADSMQEDNEQAIALLNYNPFVQQLNHLQKATEEGWVNPVDTSVALKHIEEAIKRVRAATMDIAVQEAEKHPEKELKHLGATVAIMPGRKTYSFAHIQEWKKTNDDLKKIEKDAKAAADAQANGRSFVTDDGEIITPAEYKIGSSTLRITLDK